MNVDIERLPGSKVSLSITVEPEKVQQRMDELFELHARRITVPGFRPGKAPRKMLEERVNRRALMQDAIDDVINFSYKTALQENNLDPLEQGEIDEVKPEDDLSLFFKITVTVRPEITLPAYKGVSVTHQTTEVNDEQVDAEIDRLRDRMTDFMEITDSGIEAGDYVTIDYTMQLDGQPYPEGDTTGYPLEVGTDTFFPELNEALIGMKQSETKTISKTYDDDYSNTDLAGKTAQFEIIVQQVRRRQRPEASDEWVQTVFNGAIASIADLRERIAEDLKRMAVKSDKEHIRGMIVRKIVDQAQVDIPDILAEDQFAHQMEDLEHQLSRERMAIEDYAEMINSNVSAIEQEQRVLARDRVRQYLVLQEIARLENLAVTDEDIDNALATLAPNDKEIKKLKKQLQKEGRFDGLVSRIYQDKILSFLESNADIKYEDGQPAEDGTEPPASEDGDSEE